MKPKREFFPIALAIIVFLLFAVSLIQSGSSSVPAVATPCACTR